MKKLLLTISFIINATSVSAEYAEALKDLEVLAKQGDLATQIKLASAYRKGLGVPQDYKTAVKWFTLAAEQGNARGESISRIGGLFDVWRLVSCAVGSFHSRHSRARTRTVVPLLWLIWVCFSRRFNRLLSSVAAPSMVTWWGG